MAELGTAWVLHFLLFSVLDREHGQRQTTVIFQIFFFFHCSRASPLLLFFVSYFFQLLNVWSFDGLLMACFEFVNFRFVNMVMSWVE